MMRFRILGAAAILASAMAGPAMAQQVVYNPGYCAQFYPNANCQNKGPGSPYAGDYQRQVAYRHDRMARERNWNNGYDRGDRWADRDTGFWPGDVAAGIVGGAVGTAGAIATAPFRAADSYAWDLGYRGPYVQSYAERNGFVCTPGTWFKGEDGRRHICQ